MNEWEYEIRVKGGGTRWEPRANERHARDSVNTYKWATHRIRTRSDGGEWTVLVHEYDDGYPDTLPS